MAQQSGSNSDLYFSADLQDNVSPKAEEIEKRLQKLGATKAEIKMFLTAYDQATPKIKAAQEQLKKLPKNHMINVQTNADQAHQKLQRLKEVAKAPITVTVKVKDDFDDYINKFKQRAHQMEFELKNSLRNTPLFAGMLGATGTAFNMVSGPATAATGLPFSSLGAGAAGFGAAGAMGAFFTKSFQANAELEQNMARLTQIFGGSSSRAQSAYGGVVQTSLNTPFNQQDVLGSYIRMAQAGINPAHPTYGIKAAANLGAGAQVPISQATGALQNASLGYFEEFNNLTGRNIRQSDFTYGGRYSGETYQTATQQVLKQYQNASQTQMQTFKGLMTNIQDTLMQKFILPAGTPLFNQVKGVEQKAENKLQDPATQERMLNTVTKIQEGLVKVFDYMRRGEGYFKSSLEDPLKTAVQSVLKLGQAFATTFAGTILPVVKTVSQAFTSVVTPVSQLVSSVPALGQAAGFIKALHSLGVSTNTGLGNIFGGLGHLNPVRMLEGFKQAGSLIGKIGIYELVKLVMDTKNANDQLSHSFKGLGDAGSDNLAKLKDHFDELIWKAGALGKSVNQMKTFGANAATLLGTSASDPHGNKLLKFAETGAVDQANLSRAFHMSDSDTKSLVNTWGHQLAVGRQVYQQGKDPSKVFDDMSRMIYGAAKDLSHSLGISLKDAAQGAATALSLFHKELAQSNMTSPRGASMAFGILRAAQQPGAMTARDILKFGGPEQFTQQLLQETSHPQLSTLSRAMNQYRVGNFFGAPVTSHRDAERGLRSTFSFKNEHPYQDYDLGDVRQMLKEYGNIPTSSRRMNERVAREMGVSPAGLPQFQNPLNMPVSQGGLGLNLNISQLKKADLSGSVQNMKAFQQAINNVPAALQILNQKLTDTQNEMQLMSLVVEKASSDLAKFEITGHVMGTTVENLKDNISKWQINLQQTQTSAMGLERAMASAQQQMADYEHNSVLPVQRAQEDWNQVMVRTSNHLEDIQFALGKAQFEMGKFHDGMLKGENALQDQIQALTVYNAKLDMLKLQNMGLQADLTKTQFHSGFTSTVKPLMGFDLAREKQLADERLQLKQDQYASTYGDQHYKLDRAARPLFQRMEMGFGQRMAGILQQRSIIDTSTLSGRQIQDQQYQEQLKARLLQEKMYQVTVGERPLQDKQFELSKQMFGVQQNISEQSQRIAEATNAIAQAELPYQRRIEHAQRRQQAASFGLEAASFAIQSLLGKAQNAPADLNQAFGKLQDGFDRNLITGPSSIRRTLMDLGKQMGASNVLLLNIFHALGGQGDPNKKSLPPGWGGPKNLSGPSPGDWVKGTVLNTLAPWNWPHNIATGADWVGNKVGGLMGGAAGTAAQVGVIGAGAIAGANLMHVMNVHALGGMGSLMQQRAIRKAGGIEELVGGDHPILGLESRFGGWASGLRDGAPWRAGIHPSHYLRTQGPGGLARWGTTAVGSLFGHPALGAVAGFGLEPLVEKSMGENTFERIQNPDGTHRLGRYKRGVLTKGAIDFARHPREMSIESFKKIFKSTPLEPNYVAVMDPKRVPGGASILSRILSNDPSDHVGSATSSLLGPDRMISSSLLPASESIGKDLNLTSQIRDAMSGESSFMGKAGAAFKMLRSAADLQAATAVKAHEERIKNAQEQLRVNREAARRATDAAREQERASRTNHRASEQQRENVNEARKVQRAVEDHARNNTTREGRNVDRFGKGADTFRAETDSIKGPIQDFVDAIKKNFEPSVNSFKNWVRNLPGGKSTTDTKPAEDAAEKALKDTKDKSRLAEERGTRTKVKSTHEEERASSQERGSRGKNVDELSRHSSTLRNSTNNISGSSEKVTTKLDKLGSAVDHAMKFITGFGIGVAGAETLKDLAHGNLSGAGQSAAMTVGALVNPEFAVATALQGIGGFIPKKFHRFGTGDSTFDSNTLFGSANTGTIRDVAKRLGVDPRTLGVSGEYGSTINPEDVQPTGATFQQEALHAVGGAQQLRRERRGDPTIKKAYMQDLSGMDAAARRKDTAAFQRYYLDLLKQYDHYQNDYKKRLQHDLLFETGLHAKNLRDAVKMQQNWDKLSLNDRNEYWKTYSKDQVAAYDALLRGPKGIHQYYRDVTSLTKDGLGSVVTQHHLTLDQLNKAYDSFHKLSRSQQKEFLRLYHSDQKDGLDALLKGPQGVKAFLDGQSKGFSNFFDQAVKGAGDWMNQQGKSIATGATGVNSTITKWLDSMAKGLTDWAKKNNVNVNVKDSGKLESIASNVAAGALGSITAWSNPVNFAAGGLVKEDRHKVGMDKGRIVRMVEEGHPEMVIPLAPHRRDRAKSLLRETEGMIGMAAGGLVHPKKSKDHKNPHPMSRVGGYYLPDGAYVTPREAAKYHTDKLHKFAAGGYVFPFSPAPEMWERTDMGVDFSLAAGTKIGPIGRARVGPQASWGIYGPYVEWQLLDGPRQGQWAYVAEGITNIAAPGTILNANQAVATATHGQYGIEYGWGTSTPGTTLASATTGYHEGDVTPAGSDMRNFLMGLAHGQIIGGGVGGVAGSTIPPWDPPKIPEALKKAGVSGPVVHKILQKYRDKIKKAINDKYASGGLGALAGHLSGPAWFVKAVQETDNILLNSGGGKYGALTGYSEFPSHLGTPPTTANPGVDGLGGLPGRTMLRIAANGKVVTAPKVDEGSGSLGPEWVSPPQLVMGLYPAVSNALGLSGGGPYKVGIQRVDGQPLHPAAAYGPENVAKHLGGLPRVPRDNYLAMLHQGETVLTAGDTNKHQQGILDQAKAAEKLAGLNLRELSTAQHSAHAFTHPKGEGKAVDKALLRLLKTNHQLDQDVKHRHFNKISGDIERVRDAVEHLNKAEQNRVMKEVANEIKGGKLGHKLDQQLGAKLARENHMGLTAFGKSPFGPAQGQAAELQQQLSGQLHNLRGGGKFHSLQDEIVKSNDYKLHAEQHKKAYDKQVKKYHDDQKNHASSGQLAKDRSAMANSAYSSDINHEKHLNKDIHTREMSFIKRGMQQGIARSALTYAVRNFGKTDNQGLFTDIQFGSIPSAILKSPTKGGQFNVPGYAGFPGATITGGPGSYNPATYKADHPDHKKKGKDSGSSSHPSKPTYGPFIGGQMHHTTETGSLHLGNHINFSSNKKAVDYAHKIYDHLLKQHHATKHVQHKKSKTPEQILKALKMQDKNLTKRIHELKKAHEKTEKQHEKTLSKLHKEHMKTIAKYHKEIQKDAKEGHKKAEAAAKAHLKNLEKHWKDQKGHLEKRWKSQDKQYEHKLKNLEKQRAEVRKHEKLEEKAISEAKKHREHIVKTLDNTHKVHHEHYKKFDRRDDRQNQHEQKIEKHFTKMVDHLGKISDKVHKLNPNVQNNITVEIDGKQQSNVKMSTKPSRNR